jgi:hypothetical protein
MVLDNSLIAAGKFVGRNLFGVLVLLDRFSSPKRHAVHQES